RRWLALAGLVALHLSHPLTWQVAFPAAWFPPAGIGLLLTAWLGPRAALLVGFDALLVVLLAWVRGLPAGTAAWGLLVAAPRLAGRGGGSAWGPSPPLARGARRLSAPRSAILFLVLVPGLVTGVFALLRAAWMTLPNLSALGPAAWTLWAGRAL